MTTITAKIIKDSVNESRQRITTFQLRYPRFIHAEFMTHRVFSRNAQSNRAIPVTRIIDDIKNDTAMPIYWGSNKPGMQAGEEIKETYWAEQSWLNARDAAIDHAMDLHEQGLHKQIVNRILEPYQHINVLVTATTFENFFILRDHWAAEPHIQALARQMRLKMDESVPQQLPWGEWHLPYISEEDYQKDINADQLRAVSAARCARVSYLTHEGQETHWKDDIALAERLLKDGHMSPFEHIAQSRLLGENYNNFSGWRSYRWGLEN
jgi:thymidylate synthase ThyX